MADIALRHHGGGCCGVTHLYLGEHKDPLLMLEPVKKWHWDKDNPRGVCWSGYVVDSDDARYVFVRPPYSEDRPSETAKDRAIALVEAYKKNSRSGGLIEAVITSYQKAWEPILEELGFVRGASAVNSNSFRTCTIWLLAYGKHEAFKGLLDPQ